MQLFIIFKFLYVFNDSLLSTYDVPKSGLNSGNVVVKSNTSPYYPGESPLVKTDGSKPMKRQLSPRVSRKFTLFPAPHFICPVPLAKSFTFPEEQVPLCKMNDMSISNSHQGLKYFQMIPSDGLWVLFSSHRKITHSNKNTSGKALKIVCKFFPPKMHIFFTKVYCHHHHHN